MTGIGFLAKNNAGAFRLGLSRAMDQWHVVSNGAWVISLYYYNIYYYITILLYYYIIILIYYYTWILRTGTSSSLREIRRFRPNDHYTTLTSALVSGAAAGF